MLKIILILGLFQLIIAELRSEGDADVVLTPFEIVALFQKSDGAELRVVSAPLAPLPHKIMPASVGLQWNAETLCSFYKFKSELMALNGYVFSRCHFAAIVFDACSSIASSLFLHNRVVDFPDSLSEALPIEQEKDAIKNIASPSIAVKEFRSVVWMAWRMLLSEYALDGCCFALADLLYRFELESMVLLCECCLDLLDLDPPTAHAQKSDSVATEQPNMLWQTLVDVIKLIESDPAADCSFDCLLRRDWVLLNFRVISQSLTSIISDVVPSPLLQDALVGKSDYFCLAYLASSMRSLSEASLEQFGKGWPVENTLKQLNDMTASRLLSDLSPELLPSSEKLEEWIISALNVYDKFVHRDVMLFAIKNTSAEANRVSFKKSSGEFSF